MLCDELLPCLSAYTALPTSDHRNLGHEELNQTCLARPNSGIRKCSPSTKTSGKTHVVLHVVGDAPPPAEVGAVRFVAISDTHSQHTQLQLLPDGDVLIHCGDFSNTGTLDECNDFCDFMRDLPFKHKLLVPGNHDLTCDEEWYRNNWQQWHDTFQPPEEAMNMLDAAGVFVLNGESRNVCGISVFGSAAQPRLPKGRPQMAFGRSRGMELKKEWAKIPTEGLDLLLTHSPPDGIMDMSGYGDKSIGCEELKKAVSKAKPAVHVFGHVHGGYGTNLTKHTLFVNAASARQRRGEGAAMNPPIVFDLLK